ncbi:polyphosphate polymerase domain-containing protein [Candidatus Gracilibacteria bacterium 28_42_T64]|nr:polyphosphate polymerase domain-containing protein [Candidatus Gracilibacteria bacterium 28_42_T64]
MATTFDSKLNNFSSITLTELNASASFLKRIDRKFLLTGKQFSEVLEELKENFQVLQIVDKKVFSYDNVYMDTDDYFFYNQHENKQKARTKVRTRLYKDSDLAFFEYKQKENGITSKYRYEFPSDEHGKMTKGKKRFFEGVWQSMYDSTVKVPKIFPAIKTRYKRITLVDRLGGERLTIDFDIRTLDLRDEDASETNLKNLVIIESKSLETNCKSLEIMEKHGFKQAKSCSKYSLGVVYSGLAKKYNTFKDTMKEIENIKNEMK